VRPIREALPGVDITVDGGINPDNASTAVRLGTTTLVAGTALFRSPDMRQAVERLRHTELSAQR